MWLRWGLAVVIAFHRIGRQSTPLRGDDSVELRPDQLLVGQDQHKKLFLGSRVAPGIRGRHDVAAAQALMVRRSSLLLVIEILRGFAFSATGIFKVSTPVS